MCVCVFWEVVFVCVLLFLFLVAFLQLYCPGRIPPIGNFVLPSPGKANCDRVTRNSIYGACWVFQCFHNPPNSDMDYGIFNVRTNVNACDCARGCTDTVRESGLKVHSRRKIHCRTGEWNPRQQRAGPALYQLSYIPSQKLLSFLQRQDLWKFSAAKAT